MTSSWREAGLGAVRARLCAARAVIRASSGSTSSPFPIGSLLGGRGASVVVAYLDPFRNIRGLTSADLGVSGTQVTMESPKLTGFRNDSRPYEVTASAATQDVRKPNLVELKDLRARIVTDDEGSAARLEARLSASWTRKRSR